ncbi:MAG: DNA polymerase III subunit epsilon [Betaproteobacteria bacterium]
MRQVVLDTETTGLSPENGDRILEIGCVELINRKLTGNNLHFYINPERDSHEEALKVHGISNEFLKDKPKFSQISSELLAYLNNAQVIIHNAPFDVGFLNKELERLSLKSLSQYVTGVIDTLSMAKEIYPGKRNSLDALCDRLEVDNSGRTLHGALLDAELLADVYINMTRGQDALLIEVDQSDSAQEKTKNIDFTSIDLPVIFATDDELQKHEDILLQIDKSSQGQSVWRLLQSV